MSDLARFLSGGAAGRDDSLSGLSPQMQNALAQMFAAAPEGYLTINSAYRSPEVQARLYEEALQRYGSEAEARRWVAPPGRSQHNHGMAVDLGFASDEARQWAHDNAGAYGLAFPLSNENWHVELLGARDGGAPQAQQAAAPAAPTEGNALAGLAPAPDRQQGENRLSTLLLDAADFMSRGYDQPQQAIQPTQQRYATRYLGGSRS